MGLHHHAQRLCGMVANYPPSICLPMGKKAVAASHDHNRDSVLLFCCASLGRGKEHQLLGNL